MSATRHKRKISWNSNATYYHPQLGLPDKKNGCLCYVVWSPNVLIRNMESEILNATVKRLNTSLGKRITAKICNL